MRTHEYRVVLPMTVDEYHLAQLYMVAKASREETGGGEGIQVLKNEPYETNKFNMPPGQFTEKVFYLKSKIPKWIGALFPDSLLTVTEYSWNAFPKCMTEYTNEYMGEKFYMSVETIHLPDRGNTENSQNKPAEEWKDVKIEKLDVSENLEQSFEKPYIPSQFRSQKTGRGPFVPGYIKTCNPVMTCYKIVKLKFKVSMIGSRIEKWGQYYGMRSPFISFHRKLVCWMDEWAGLTLEDIREYEEETAKIVKVKIGEGVAPANGTKSS